MPCRDYVRSRKKLICFKVDEKIDHGHEERFHGKGCTIFIDNQKRTDFPCRSVKNTEWDEQNGFQVLYLYQFLLTLYILMDIIPSKLASKASFGEAF